MDINDRSGGSCGEFDSPTRGNCGPLPPNVAGGTGGARFGSGVLFWAHFKSSGGGPVTRRHHSSVNGQTVGNVKALVMQSESSPGDPVVLLIERQGGLGFVSSKWTEFHSRKCGGKNETLNTERRTLK